MVQPHAISVCLQMYKIRGYEVWATGFWICSSIGVFWMPNIVPHSDLSNLFYEFAYFLVCYFQ